MESQPNQESESKIADLEKALAELSAELKRCKRAIEIDNTLEKIRTVALAMRDSSELSDTSAALFTQLNQLGINPIRASVGIFDDVNDAMELWQTTVSDTGDQLRMIDYVSLHLHTVYERIIPARLQGKPFVLTILNGKAVQDFYQQTPAYLLQARQGFNRQECFYSFFFAAGAINLITVRELSEEECDVMIQIAHVFDLVYTRFLDLKRAESKTREANIESALERVRHRVMAMETSGDVDFVIADMFGELEKLGIETMHCGFYLGKGNELIDDWAIHNSQDSGTSPLKYQVDMNAVPLQQLLQRALERKEELLFYILAGEEKSKFFKVLPGEWSEETLELSHHDIPDQYLQGFRSEGGVIWTLSLKPHSPDEASVLKRFSSVFSMTHRRFLDLKRSEDETRIKVANLAADNALERAIAMRSSEELPATMEAILSEIRQMGYATLSFGLVLWLPETEQAGVYATEFRSTPSPFAYRGEVNPGDISLLEKVGLKARRQDENSLLFLTSADLPKAEQGPLRFVFPDAGSDHKYYGYFVMFEGGFFFGWNERPLEDSEADILLLFKPAADLAFRRYFELQNAEAVSRQAIRQASLDRIRAETASMRHTSDLEGVTPKVWNELTRLGVPFIRCGMFIMDEQKKEIHTLLSSPDGTGIAAFHLPFTARGTIQSILSHWRARIPFTEHWDSHDIEEWFRMLVEENAMSSNDGYIVEAHPDSMDLHFFPFPQGMLYVGNSSALDPEQMAVSQAVTDAFAAAYARYEDFIKLETAKQQVEKTLADLQQTQSRLIQTEKLASLGELTAGIAHEIQNPLNFVNNFSEINIDLTDELVDAASRGDQDELKSIADTLKSNHQKISEHGKRADGIVKSMLQHSRSNSGQKELTDVNKLVDEYVRLAYHGYRARQKDFNVKLNIELDPAAGFVQMAAQDIGRAVLNLLNNAFHAVQERTKTAGSGYDPTVGIRTERTDLNLSISVTDNGSGIPENIREKIFQPFFTTKPTGQGTGLGLSLSFDIVTKSHGGTIELSETQHQGTTFVIRIPTQEGISYGE